MRIPFPERIPIWYVCAFAGLLFVLQTLQHTDPIVSLCCLGFTILAGFAFNLAGGFTRPSGSYVFFFATLAVIVGITVKAVIWEAADSNLVNPRLTFQLYLGGIVAMLAATYLNQRFRRRSGFLEQTVSAKDMRKAAIGCVVVGILFPYIASLYADSTDTLFTPILKAANQLNRFLPMAIILGVTYEVKQSGGRRSLNLWVVIAAAVIFFEGVILSYSKESLFLPPLCWLAAGAALGYRYRPYQILVGLGVLYFFMHYMVPYCQYGRIYRNSTATLSENLANSRALLSDLPEVVRVYKEGLISDEEEQMTAVYFNQTQGLFDRLQMISFDDALNQVEQQKGHIGLQPVIYYIENSVPHFIWKNKPSVSMNNFYGHEIGILAEDDVDTSISFSPVGEAFRLEGWVGIFLLAPIVWFVLFIVTDSVCGDLRRSPWGILAFAAFSHAGPEGGIGGCIYLATYGIFIIVFVAFFSAYVMPLVATFFAIPARRPFRPFPAMPPQDRPSRLLPTAPRSTPGS